MGNAWKAGSPVGVFGMTRMSRLVRIRCVKRVTVAAIVQSVCIRTSCPRLKYPRANMHSKATIHIDLGILNKKAVHGLGRP
jgi:hypothetical protein